jgi:hypothetical protein
MKSVDRYVDEEMEVFHVWFGSLFERMVQGPHLGDPPANSPQTKKPLGATVFKQGFTILFFTDWTLEKYCHAKMYSNVVFYVLLHRLNICRP